MRHQRANSRFVAEFVGYENILVGASEGEAGSLFRPAGWSRGWWAGPCRRRSVGACRHPLTPPGRAANGEAAYLTVRPSDVAPLPAGQQADTSLERAA